MNYRLTKEQRAAGKVQAARIKADRLIQADLDAQFDITTDRLWAEHDAPPPRMPSIRRQFMEFF